jgi:hypothetical protein
MAGLGTFATTAIITKGLTCGGSTLCKTGLITTHFSLYCSEPYVPPPPTSGGGGYYPHDAWNKFENGDIKDFYKPVEPQPLDTPYDPHKHITMKVKIGDNEYEKTWSIPENRAKPIVKALKFANSTMDNMNVTVNNVKKLTNDAIVKVKGFKLKKK